LHPLLAKLNPRQREAVEAIDGPVLILAGAGSGKTRVITHRIAYLIQERGIAPDSILAVTFTNKAAGEMRERVAALVGDDERQPWVSTFHSACARILRQEGHALGYDRNFSILDESDSLTTIRRVLEDAALADSPPLELARARIEQAKNEAISPEDMLASAQPGRETSIAQIYLLYQERMRATTPRHKSLSSNRITVRRKRSWLRRAPLSATTPNAKLKICGRRTARASRSRTSRASPSATRLTISRWKSRG
jgi:DNA helicase-2/ATP-dependent DNA helicase PcrA